MSQIDELISKLQEVSNHPQKTVLNYKKQGKGLVGMMPYYSGRTRIICCRLPPGTACSVPRTRRSPQLVRTSSVRLLLDAG